MCHKVCKGPRGLKIHQATHRIDTSKNRAVFNNNSSDAINANLQTQMPSLLDPQFNEKSKIHFVNLVKKKDTKKNMLTKFKCDAFSAICKSECICVLTNQLRTNYIKIVKFSTLVWRTNV